MTKPPRGILLVDDDPQILDLYSRMLAELGEISTAASAEAAITALDESIDVIVLDRRMPGESGDALLREIRRLGHDCGVIIVSAVEPAADIIDLSFQDYLVKPVTGAELKECIERVLALSARDIQMQRYLSLLARRRVLEESVEVGHDERDGALDELARQLADLEDQIEPAMGKFDRELVARLAAGPVTDQAQLDERRRELIDLFNQTEP